MSDTITIQLPEEVLIAALQQLPPERRRKLLARINETLNLLSIPGMRESLVEGKNTPIEDCNDEVEW